MSDLATIASLIGDPARAQIVTALLDGRALTATELALAASVAPSTASSHLQRLCKSGVLERAVQGRHRYFRLASADVASVLESLLALGAVTSTVHTGPREPALRAARVCYDHLAGEAGVALFDAMHAREYITANEITIDGERWVSSIGIDVAALQRSSRPTVRRCLDWSERRDHAAGALGAALLDRFLAKRWLRREARGRTVIVTAAFRRFLAEVQA